MTDTRLPSTCGRGRTIEGCSIGSDSRPSGEHRRFVTAIVVDTVGSGVFMPISMLYFLAMTDLSLVQVGSAICRWPRC